MEAKTKIVSATRVATEIDGYTITAEPHVNKGGSGEYPTPVLMALAALLNCSVMVLKSFCESRDIPTDELELDFSGEAEDGIYKNMEFKITLPKEFPEKYKNSIENVVATCSVKKLIKNLPEINIKLSSLQ